MNFGVSVRRSASGADYAQTAVSLRRGTVEITKTEVDPEQQAKFDEIISLLLAGGYFRARISTLDPFDKVAGGMAWSIRAANENVDVDLLFQEGLRMGEKIHLSENLEKAMARMKCPYPIQAQQIYYLDCINVYPAVQWLVKKVIEVRSQTADTLRLFSESQFAKEYRLPDEAEEKGENFIAGAKNRYTAARKYKVKSAKVSAKLPKRATLGPRGSNLTSNSSRKVDVDAHIHSVLVEYGSGHLYTMALLQKRQEQDTSKSASMSSKRASIAGIVGGGKDAEEAANAEREAALMAQKREEQMLRDSMQELKLQGEVDMTDLVEARLKMLSDDSAKAQDEFGKAHDAMEQQTAADSRLKGVQMHKRYLLQVEKMIKAEQAKLDALKPKYDELHEELQDLQGQYDKVSGYNAKIVAETQKLEALETDETRPHINMLRALVALNETLKQQIGQFKQTAKEQMAEWQKKIEEQKKDETGDERWGSIMQTYDKDLQKLRTIQSHLSAKTRAIALVRRKMDEIPSRRELQQYQKHFLELYEQMALRFTETRQYYNTFNTLQDRREFLQREVTILNQIQENYPIAMKSKAAKTKFAEQIGAIADQLAKSLEKAQSKAKEEKEKSGALDQTHQSLVEKEREYYKAAKEFQEECKKTELLQRKLAEYE